MRKDIRISMIQAALIWENASGNRSRLEKQIRELPESDLILLPEMFTTAFSMDSARLAEKMDGVTLAWMQEMASNSKAVVCGSLIVEESGKHFNRLIWMRPDGKFEHYDKRHLFRMADEEKHFTAGFEKLIVDLNGWKICPLICYDLRFPVWSRRTAKQDYDVLIYVANWPSPRASAWEKLLYSRAIENQAYVLGLNRVGEDAKGNQYIGKSMAVDAKGDLLWKGGAEENVETISLTYSALDQFRQKFPVGLDADDFEIN